MKNLKKVTLILLSALSLSLAFAGGTVAAQDDKEQLQQKLQSLKQENNEAEVKSLKEQIAEEEKKKAEREGTISASQAAVTQPDVSQKEPEKSTWVREKNRLEDQAKDKIEKLGKLF